MSIASEEFEYAADTQSRALGMVDAHCVFVKHPIQDANDTQMREKADAILEQVIEALRA